LNYYYIEYRFHGYPKRYLNSLIREISRKFGVTGALKNRAVPHITLYGPFETNHSYAVFRAIERVAKRYTLIPFTVDGFDSKAGNNVKVIVARIIPSPELIRLRMELAQELNRIVRSENRQPWDSESKYWFHSTIAMKDIDGKFDAIKKYLSKKDQPHIHQHMVRMTILNCQRKIVGEYDLVLQRWLNRRQSLSNRLWRKTVNRLCDYRGLPRRKYSFFEKAKSILFFWGGN
jgi:2'-5' RNA ligase